MATINQLSATDTLTGGDLLPVYVSDNGDARKASLTLLKTYMQNNLTFPSTSTGISQFVPQYASPAATGFTITMTSASANAWLIITPLGAYAAGTITFPALANCTDNQEIILVTTQAITALTINGNGATVIGAPGTLSQFGGARFKFNALSSAWYRLDEDSPAFTAFGLSLINDVDATAGRATLGLGTIATQNANAVAITGGTMSGVPAAFTSGTITGITDLAVADGGTGASTAAAAATNLGLGTGDSPQFTAVNIGNATDTTVTRVSAGVIAVEGATVATLSTAQTFTAQQTLTSGLVIQTATAASIAAIANAINTANKVAGKVVYDTTNNRIMIASGALAASNWYVADGSASVTPS